MSLSPQKSLAGVVKHKLDLNLSLFGSGSPQVVINESQTTLQRPFFLATCDESIQRMPGTNLFNTVVTIQYFVPNDDSTTAGVVANDGNWNVAVSVAGDSFTSYSGSAQFSGTIYGTTDAVESVAAIDDDFVKTVQFTMITTT